VGTAIGSGTVVYNGDGTAYTNAGLSAGTTYDYKFYSENYSYYSAGVTAGATTPKLDQTIDFPAIGNQLTTNEVALSATASSGLTVSFAVGSGPANIAGTTLTFTGAGSVSIVASQAGNAAYNAAPDVTNTFDVTEPDLAVVLSQAAVNVREAGEGRFFVRLNKDPGAEVAVAVGRSAGDASLTVQDGATRTFKSANWSSWQTVTLAAPADDADVDGETATFQVAMSGAADQFVEATTLDDDFTNNLALASGGSEISASYAYSRPEQLIDGVHVVNTNYGYAVCTSVPPGTITLDLKATATVSRVRILTWDWVRLVHRYTIESSTNGVDWTTLIDATAADHHGWDDWAVADVALRYLRFTGESTTQSRDALSVAELEVYGTRDLSGLPQVELLKTSVNVREAGEGRFFLRLDKAPEGLVTVSVARDSGDAGLAIQGGAIRTFKASNWSTWQAVTLTNAADADADGETAVFRVSLPGRADQFVTATALDDEIGNNLARASAGSTIAGSRSSRAAEMIDGIHAASTNYGYTIWTNVPRGYVTLDMKQSMLLSRIRLLNWDWVYRAHRYTIESSEDGANWSLLVDASAEEHVGWDDWALSDPSARYLRFTGVSNTANSCVVLSELEVYGVPGPLPGLEVSSASVNVREGGEGRFFVRLAHAPTGNVAVAVARSGGNASLTVQQGAARSFTPLNWNQWQVVTLAQAADENADGETATFQVSATGYESTYVDAAALDDDVAENLALTATVTAWK
ncbi:MAG TPA: discoidin domain-containing protein, partial [Kiritimatiellia bacterium]|nr:discoidin domain-containing protein [Kiritimatiellia bacterium]